MFKHGPFLWRIFLFLFLSRYLERSNYTWCCRAYLVKKLNSWLGCCLLLSLACLWLENIWFVISILCLWFQFYFCDFNFSFWLLSNNKSILRVSENKSTFWNFIVVIWKLKWFLYWILICPIWTPQSTNWNDENSWKITIINWEIEIEIVFSFFFVQS